jgi:hypothetical protein
VALARKVAGILFAMMRDEREFRPWQDKEVERSAA